MIIPINAKPFKKKMLQSVIDKQRIAWILVAISAPLLSIFTLYMFNQYANVQISLFVKLLIIIQIMYSAYFTYIVYARGIITNKIKLKNYKDNDLIYFTDIVDPVVLNKMYFVLILFIIPIISVAIISF